MAEEKKRVAQSMQAVITGLQTAPDPGLFMARTLGLATSDTSFGGIVAQIDAKMAAMGWVEPALRTPQQSVDEKKLLTKKRECDACGKRASGPLGDLVAGCRLCTDRMHAKCGRSALTNGMCNICNEDLYDDND
jgi:hypothetical protein